MKKLHQPFLEELPPLRLYLDDLEDVVDLLTRQGFVVQISADNHAFDGVDELPQLKSPRLKNLTIQGTFEKYKGTVIVSVSRFAARVQAYVLDDDASGRSNALAALVFQRLLRARDRRAWFTRSIAVGSI